MKDITLARIQEIKQTLSDLSLELNGYIDECNEVEGIAIKQAVDDLDQADMNLVEFT